MTRGHDDDDDDDDGGAFHRFPTLAVHRRRCAALRLSAVEASLAAEARHAGRAPASAHDRWRRGRAAAVTESDASEAPMPPGLVLAPPPPSDAPAPTPPLSPSTPVTPEEPTVDIAEGSTGVKEATWTEVEGAAVTTEAEAVERSLPFRATRSAAKGTRERRTARMADEKEDAGRAVHSAPVRTCDAPSPPPSPDPATPRRRGTARTAAPLSTPPRRASPTLFAADEPSPPRTRSVPAHPMDHRDGRSVSTHATPETTRPTPSLGAAGGLVASMAAKFDRCPLGQPPRVAPRQHASRASPPPPDVTAAALAAQIGHRGGRVAAVLRGRVAAMEAAALEAAAEYDARGGRRRPRMSAPAAVASCEAATRRLCDDDEGARERAAATAVQAAFRGFRGRKTAAAAR